MSGYKSSNIQYTQRGKILLEIRNTNYSLSEQLNFLQIRFDEFCQRKKEAQKLLDNLNLNEIDKREKTLIDVFNDLKITQGKFEKIYKNINRLTIQELQKIRESSFVVLTELKKIRDEIDNLEDKLKSIININKQLTELKDIESKIEIVLKNNIPIIKEWRADEYQKLLQEKDKLSNEIQTIAKTNDIELIKKALVKSRSYLTRLNGIINNCKEKDERAKAQLKQIETQIKEIQQKLILAKTDIIVTKVKEFLLLLETEVESILNKELKDTSGLLIETQKVLPVLLEIDKHIFETDKIINDISKKWREKEQKLQRWYSEQSAQLKAKIDEFVNNFENFKLTILSKNIFELEKSREFYNSFRAIMDELDSLIEDVNGKEELHQKRLYVIKALREVCASLGFKELELPHYAEEDNVYSPIVQTFDTLNSGIIKFIITLDGKLESDSGISSERCGLEFTDISELLKNEFGVETEFKIIEENEPLKKYKSAKDLPKTSNKKFNEG